MRSEIEFTPRLSFRAFSSEKPQHYPVLVDPTTGEIRVWDSVSRIYTVNHVTSPWHASRIMAEARRLAAE